MIWIDYSALRYLYRLQREYGLGCTIDLIPEPDDPKDLFGLLREGSDAPAGSLVMVSP